MRKIFLASFLSLYLFANAQDTAYISKPDTSLELLVEENVSSVISIYEERLQELDDKTPMDLSYNKEVQPFIDGYLSRNKSLIVKMKELKKLYFPLFEQELDKHGLPLELKYLAIVESALNPKAKSGSGATGLWQFMYLTGKEYGLEVNSYIDDRQDPLKSTQAACKYFLHLYEMFGDWNLVLAAYNGGPGYLQRKINTVGSYDFWDLHPHLRQETRNYIPTFIAVNYAMQYAEEHDIFYEESALKTGKIDTVTIKKQVEIKTLSELLCLDQEIIKYLNPSYKKDVFPKNAVLILPAFVVMDFLNNEEANYTFINLVDKKEILIDEERIIYKVRKGDYLGRIAEEYGVRVFELKQWNTLRSTALDIGDELVIYVKKNQKKTEQKINSKHNEYVIQKGDTLWDIAQKHKGVSVWKIKSLNNLESDNLKPGTKIILPTT